MDISALVTMKNAANCENHCELQNHESVDFWTQPVPFRHVWFSASFAHNCKCCALAKIWRLKSDKLDLKTIWAPELKQDYPLNLSISVSGGKETNKDYLSSGERSGKSSKWKSVAEMS